MPSKLKILKNAVIGEDVIDDTSLIIHFEDLKNWIKKGVFWKHLFSYQEVYLITYNLKVLTKPLITALFLRFLSYGRCFLEDETGQRETVTINYLIKLFLEFIRDYTGKYLLLKRVKREISNFQERKSQLRFQKNCLTGSPVYLRTDLWFGVRSGGSVGHIAGVLNHLERFTDSPVFLTSDLVPTVKKEIETHVILPERRYRDFQELPLFYYNEKFFQAAGEILSTKEIAFIYQRYSLNNYTGIKLATFYKVPLVLEYNGSEIWISGNWGKPLKYSSLAEKIELLNLKLAYMIVVVSRSMEDELVARGVDCKKILVNPNGVDLTRYTPSVDGSNIRDKYYLNGKTVIGFIGTFGKWHGAEILAEAFGRLLTEIPSYREKIRLLMIGDGVTLPKVKEIVSLFNVGAECVFTGQIPQERGPEYLAACDILISPHVPNPDGTPFFGSPTKLFEYMAMGKGIIASELGQIGEVLKHKDTAWFVKPGDTNSLITGLQTLLANEQLRDDLGRAAREEVIKKYSWEEHTRKIIKKIEELKQEGKYEYKP